MLIRCCNCGKNVCSHELPDDAVIRAWIECPECVASLVGDWMRSEQILDATIAAKDED
jgi:hypothetical protein